MTEPPQNGRARLYIAVAVVAFAVLAGGTSAGWLVPGVRVVSVAAMAGLIGWWLRLMSRGVDRVDLGVAIALGAHALAALGSIVPRLSIESLYAAMAFAAMFGTVRRLSPMARSALLVAMSLVGSVLAMAILVLWLGAWVRWTELTGMLPSLGLRLPSAPFGHPHDVPLLLGLLLPAAFVARWDERSRASRIAAVSIAGALVAVSAMSGGRGVWVALIGATGAVAALSSTTTFGWIRRHWIGASVALVIVVGAALSSGFGTVVITRLTATVSLDMRFAIWGGALSAGWERPMLGSGPGTFPFILQSAGYFDQASFAPAHADSIYVQALAELGVLGALSLALAIAVVMAAWRARRPPTAAIWALLFAAIAGVTANPTALGYCAILIATWAGLATPLVQPRWRAPALFTPIAVGVGAIGVGVLALSTAATLSYAAARGDAVNAPSSSLARVDAVVAMDPGFPLYQRERGVLLLSVGRAEEAIGELEKAALLNDQDDTTLRSLAIAALSAGDPERARVAARQARDLQQTEALNHATLAYVADALGDATTRDNSLARLVVLAPWAAVDPAWEPAFPDVSPNQAVRWAAETQAAADGPFAPGIRWAKALAGGEDRMFSSAQSAFSDLVRCQLADAESVLAAAPDSDRRSGDYWFARLVVEQLGGRDASVALETYLTLSSPVRREGSPFGAPLTDETAYARLPLPHGGLDLPSYDDGVRAWISDPDRAIATIRGGEACPGG